MPWQDWIFTIGQFIFVLALIPSIKGKDKPAFITSLITTIILYSFSATYITLGLWGSGLFAGFNATAWAILAIQKYLVKRKQKN